MMPSETPSVAPSESRQLALRFLAWSSALFLTGLLIAVAMKLIACYGGEVDQLLLGRALTYHGVIMTFLFIVPAIPSILGHLLLPSSIGSETLARPALSRAGFGLYVAGTLLVLVSSAKFAVGTGWTFLPPYSLIDGGALFLMTLGIALTALSWILTAIVFIVSVNQSRREASFLDLPPLAWSIYLNSFLMVVGGLLLTVLVALLEAANLFGWGPFAGLLSAPIWQQGFSMAMTPLVFFALIPALGVISDLVAGLAGRPLVAARSVIWSLIALTLLAVATWGSHLTAAGQGPKSDFVFSALGLLVAIPAALISYSWLATLERGAARRNAATIYVIAFIFNSTIALLLGLFASNLSIGSYLDSTLFSTAIIHYLLMGGVVTALLAGLHFRWAEIASTPLGQAPANLAALLYAVGTNLAFFPQIIMGSRGLPQGAHALPADLATLGAVSSLGMAILAIGLTLAAVNMIVALRRG